MNNKRFDGSRVLVTGAGSGIGQATAQRFAAEGAQVACLDLRGHDDTAAAIGAAGFPFECNVADGHAVAGVVEAVVGALGGLDVVCNIAGIGHFRNSHEETPEDFDRIVGVNLHGTFHIARYALPHLLAAGSGVIINTASTAGLIGQPWSAAYCASKGGVVMLTKALATEYRGRNIRVNAIAPGGTKTNILDSFSTYPEGADLRQLIKVMSPMEMAEPAEIAALFAFIASDEARYMTGSIVAIDGGITS
ncbi:MAG TPA: SDR family oxidoreductase [Ilumatobacteraceae bacterium]|nr:SDR family oxidoreductase [Ilumatobacteraceae bacterium]